MIIKKTFKEWDYEAIWDIIEGETYPYFQWQEEPGGHNYPHRYEIILIVNPKEGGVVYGEGIYEEGEEVEIAAEAKQGWEFIEWTGDIKYADNPEQASATVTMPAEDIALTANFKDVVYVKDIVEADVKVFPNPARNKIFIKSNELIKQIRLVNSSGQVVKNIAVDAHRAKLNVNSLTSGIYFVQAYSDKGVSTLRIKVFR